MNFAKNYTHFFTSGSDCCAPEIRAYLAGLMQAKRGAKNMERMEEHVPDFAYQNVHNAIAHAPWDHRALMNEVAAQADGLLGGGPRVRAILDDSGWRKKGSSSVGVARQYLGSAGKVDNGQVAVCTSLASGQQSTLIDIRLYLPEVWCGDALRCEKAHIPAAERHFRSKSQLALESIRHQRERGIRFDVVSMDSGYGSDAGLLHALDADGETFVAEVHRDAHIWTQAPWPHQHSKRQGKALKHPVASQPSERVDGWSRAQSDTAWQRLKVRGSDRGWVEVSYLAERIWVMAGAEAKPWWLLAWEDPDEKSNDGRSGNGPRRHYALSNAAADSDPRLLIKDALGRNMVERNFRDAKSEVGMAYYQTRGWNAWQHHMALVMLAMFFLLQEKMHSPAVATAEGEVTITSGDITFILERLLPQRGQGSPQVREVRAMLESRIKKRERDQVQRRRKTRADRPPLWPDEEI